MTTSKLPAESNRPTVLNPQDKNKDRGKHETQKRIAILGALAKSMVKPNARV
jgi:hypothetical protein